MAHGEKCTRCKGRGKIETAQGPGVWGSKKIDCPDCDGKGFLVSPDANGDSFMPEKGGAE